MQETDIYCTFYISFNIVYVENVPGGIKKEACIFIISIYKTKTGICSKHMCDFGQVLICAYTVVKFIKLVCIVIYTDDYIYIELVYGKQFVSWYENKCLNLTD